MTQSDTAPPQATDPKAIQVWRFADAPQALRDLSEHGGDEDWLALIPSELAASWIPWLESGMGSGFGNDVSVHLLPDGSVVRIGAHA